MAETLATLNDKVDQLLRLLDDLPRRLLVRANQIVVLGGLSDISETLGIIKAGEFRAGNRSEPGRGFSGMRLAYPPMAYSNDLWNLVGIENDVLQFGVRASDGKLLAGGGSVVLDQNGITAVGGTIAGWQIQPTKLVSPGTPGIQIDSNGNIQTTNFATDVRGWRIANDGTAEFQNAKIRGELQTTIFTKREVQVTGGTLGIFKSAGVLLEDVTVTTGTFTIKIKDPQGAHEQLFAVDDILHLKDATNSTWVKVTAVTDNTTYYTYTVQYQSGTSGVTYYAGQAIADYGSATSSPGHIIMSADDVNAPYISLRKHTGTPWSSVSELLKIGNLNGSWGYTSEKFGVAIGEYASGKANITIDEDGAIRIRNYTSDVIVLSGTDARISNVLKLSDANSALSIGNPPPSSSTSGTGIWIDRNQMVLMKDDVQNIIISPTEGIYINNPSDAYRQERAIRFDNLYSIYRKIVAAQYPPDISIPSLMIESLSPTIPHKSTGLQVNLTSVSSSSSDDVISKFSYSLYTENYNLQNIAQVFGDNYSVVRLDDTATSFAKIGARTYPRSSSSQSNYAFIEMQTLFPGNMSYPENDSYITLFAKRGSQSNFASLLGLGIFYLANGSQENKVLSLDWGFGGSMDNVLISTRPFELSYPSSIEGITFKIKTSDNHAGLPVLYYDKASPQDAKIPLGYSPPWFILPFTTRYMMHSFNPIINANYIIEDCGVPVSGRRNLTAQTNWQGHRAINTNESVINFLEYYGTNSSNQYFYNTSGLPYYTSNITNAVSILTWIFPSGSGGTSRGILQSGTTTIGFALYIDSSNKAVFNVYDTGGALIQVVSTNQVVFNKWNYIFANYDRNVRMMINLNGVETFRSTTPTTQIRMSSGDFRLGWGSAAGTLNGQLGWTAIGIYFYESYKTMVLLSRPWHYGGA